MTNVCFCNSFPRCLQWTPPWSTKWTLTSTATLTPVSRPCPPCTTQQCPAHQATQRPRPPAAPAATAPRWAPQPTAAPKARWRRRQRSSRRCPTTWTRWDETTSTTRPISTRPNCTASRTGSRPSGRASSTNIRRRQRAAPAAARPTLPRPSTTTAPPHPQASSPTTPTTRVCCPWASTRPWSPATTTNWPLRPQEARPERPSPPHPPLPSARPPLPRRLPARRLEPTWGGRWRLYSEQDWLLLLWVQSHWLLFVKISFCLCAQRRLFNLRRKWYICNSVSAGAAIYVLFSWNRTSVLTDVTKGLRGLTKNCFHKQCVTNICALLPFKHK